MRIFIVIFLFILLLGCSSNSIEPQNIIVDDVASIKLFGKKFDGKIAPETEKNNIIQWIHEGKQFMKSDLPLERPAPASMLSINLTSNKVVRIFLWGDKLVFESSDSTFFFEQQNLKDFLKNLES